MGSYTFKWEHPEASEVFVTGTFDDWGKTQKLDKQSNGFFEKTVKLPKKEKTLYKFVVDNNWTTNSHLPIEKDSSGNENNVLGEKEILGHPTEAAIGTVGAGATTAALAAAVPKESEKSKGVSLDAPGAFPETPAAEPESFSVNPIPATEGAGNPVKLAPGEKVPDASTMTSNTISSTVKDDEEMKAADKAAGEQIMSVNPIPATSGAGNPIKLAPGEPVPDASTMTGNTVQNTVKLDEASYNASDAAVAGLPPPGAEAKEAEVNPATAGMFGVPPATGTMIPESSLPMGEGEEKKWNTSAGPMLAGGALGATTAAMAGQVPLEPRGVPEVVSESQQEAKASPEAAANPVAVEEKKEMEEELKAKVPEEGPAAESGLPTGKIAAAVTGGVAAAGAAVAAGVGLASEKAKTVASDAQTAYSGMTTSNAAPDASVPEPVKESLSEAKASPEAAANPEALAEKAAVESELESKVKPVESAGEPAPTMAAATSETAPAPTKADSGALNASAAAPATTEATKEDISPKATDTASTPVNGTPATTTGVATESTPAKSEAATSTPAKSEATPAKSEAGPAAPSTPSKKPLDDATNTPGTSESTKTDKKSKRKSIMAKIKKFLD